MPISYIQIMRKNSLNIFFQRKVEACIIHDKNPSIACAIIHLTIDVKLCKRYHDEERGGTMETLAHINIEGNTQSLKNHCESTFAQIQHAAAARGLSHCMELIAFLHDIGKASDEFQEYLQKAATGIHNSNKIPHSFAGGQVVVELFDKYAIHIESLAVFMLAQTIVSHHGLTDFISPEGDNKLYQRCFPKHHPEMKNMHAYLSHTYNEEELVQLCKLASEEIHSYSARFITQKNLKYFTFNIGALQRLMISLLMHGDREDTRNFMEKTQTIEYHEDYVWKDASSKLEEHLQNLHANAEKTKINQLRAFVSEQCASFGIQPTGIYRLSCPTGSGKTLASLRYALKHAAIYHKKHIIYVAPFKTILEQNADVLRQFFSEDMVLEHHSNISPSDFSDYSYFTTSWNKPVIMTTAVRLYDTLFKSRSSDVRRFHQLADSILIFDEAQKIPVDIVYMFNEMMNFLTDYCNTTIILCTATQPLLEKVAYPIHLSKPTEIVQMPVNYQEDFQRVHLVNACKRGGFSMQDLADFIYQKTKTAKNILIIVNTKAEALDLYHLCKQRNESENVEVFHLSTNMCPAHRNDVLKEVTASFETDKTSICIATNLIEAGVDLSADIVIRSLCGLDSILQAAGRCNRHGSNEHMGIVYLINSNEEHIQKLKDVRKGQEVTKILLEQLRKQKNDTCVDELLTESYIQRYYEQYFFDRRNDMDCKTDIGSLFELLSRSHVTAFDHANFTHFLLCHAMKSAGDVFDTMDSNTIGILVPYGYGKELISLFQSQMSNAEKYKLLDKAQRYMVNVYENKYQDLIKEDMIEELEFNNLLVLREGFYKDDTGLEMQKELDDLFV